MPCPRLFEQRGGAFRVRPYSKPSIAVRAYGPPQLGGRLKYRVIRLPGSIQVTLYLPGRLEVILFT